MISENKLRTPNPLISADEVEVRALYLRLLDSWNERNSNEFASQFSDEGTFIGFDGTQVNGSTEIEAHLLKIFSDHVPGHYVGKVRHVQLLSPSVALLNGIAGMVPAGRLDIEPKLNAVHTLVSLNRNGKEWRIVLFQNTPAQFHGLPEQVKKMTDELQELL